MYFLRTSQLWIGDLVLSVSITDVLLALVAVADTLGVMNHSFHDDLRLKRIYT